VEVTVSPVISDEDKVAVSIVFYPLKGCQVVCRSKDMILTGGDVICTPHAYSYCRTGKQMFVFLTNLCYDLWFELEQVFYVITEVLLVLEVSKDVYRLGS